MFISEPVNKDSQEAKREKITEKVGISPISFRGIGGGRSEAIQMTVAAMKVAPASKEPPPFPGSPATLI